MYYSAKIIVSAKRRNVTQFCNLYAIFAQVHTSCSDCAPPPSFPQLCFFSALIVFYVIVNAQALVYDACVIHVVYKCIYILYTNPAT